MASSFCRVVHQHDCIYELAQASHMHAAPERQPLLTVLLSCHIYQISLPVCPWGESDASASVPAQAALELQGSRRRAT